MGDDHHLLILRRRRLLYRVTRAEGARRRRLFAGAEGADWLAGCTSLSALEMLCCVLLEGPIFSKGRLRRAPSAKAFGLAVHPHHLLLVQVLQTGAVGTLGQNTHFGVQVIATPLHAHGALSGAGPRTS